MQQKIYKAYFIFFVALMATVPVIIMPGIVQIFSLPKAILTEIGALVLIVLFILYFLAGKERHIFRGRLDIPVLFFIGWVLVATLFSKHLPTSLLGHYSRHEGLIAFVAYVIIYFAAVQISWDKVRLETLYFVLTITAGLISLYGLAQFVGLEPLSALQKLFESQRSSSTFGNPGMLSSYLVLVLPLGLWLSLSKGLSARRLWYARLATISIIVAIITTFSRGGWLAAVIAIAIFFWLGKSSLSWRPIIIGLTIIVSLFSVVSLYSLNNPGAANLPNRIISLTRFSSLTDRVEIWRTALIAIHNQPITGTGPGAFKFAYRLYKTDGSAKIDARVLDVDVTHNILLEVAATMGLPALLAFLIIMVGFFYYCHRLLSQNNNMPAALSAAVAGYLVSAVFEPASVGSSVLFWALLGIVSGLAARRQLYYERLGKPVSAKVLTLTSGALIATVLAFSFFLIKPLVADRYAQLGWQIKGDSAAAETYYEQAILWNDLGVYRLNLADLALKRFTASGSKADLDGLVMTVARATRAHPDEANLYLFAARGYFEAADKRRLVSYSKAIEPLKQTLALCPKMPDAHYLLGNVYLEQGKFAEASRELKYALKFAPNWPSAWGALGFSLEKQEKLREARIAYRETVRQRPDWTQAKQALDILEKRLRR